jgi:hypothetical protein
MSFGSISVRKGIRENEFVIDKTITEVGFSGIENIDWEKIKATTL